MTDTTAQQKIDLVLNLWSMQVDIRSMTGYQPVGPSPTHLEEIPMFR